MSATQDIVARATELSEDLSFAAARAWKSGHPGRKVVGYMPVYVPRELIHAAGMLPLGVVGGGDRLEVIHGDAYFQSYICRIPRSTIELAISGRLDVVDAMLFPSVCDVIRNLSGMWKVMFPHVRTRYLDLPQNYSQDVGGAYYAAELRDLLRDLGDMRGRAVKDDELHASILVYEDNRRLVRELYDLRASETWRVPATESYVLLRAGLVLPVEAHNAMLSDYLDAARREDRARRDTCRVVLTGAFCEQPPLGLLRSLELAGCSIVDDDLLLGTRWLTAPVASGGDPVDALAQAFLRHSVATASRYEADGARKGADLVEAVRRTEAEGVIFASPSFCDPALLERPMAQRALRDANIPYIAFKYAENSAQFQSIREQAGTFADSLKLWAGT